MTQSVQPSLNSRRSHGNKTPVKVRDPDTPKVIAATSGVIGLKTALWVSLLMLVLAYFAQDLQWLLIDPTPEVHRLEVHRPQYHALLGRGWHDRVQIQKSAEYSDVGLGHLDDI